MIRSLIQLNKHSLSCSWLPNSNSSSRHISQQSSKILLFFSLSFLLSPSCSSMLINQVNDLVKQTWTIQQTLKCKSFISTLNYQIITFNCNFCLLLKSSNCFAHLVLLSHLSSTKPQLGLMIWRSKAKKPCLNVLNQKKHCNSFSFTRQVFKTTLNACFSKCSLFIKVKQTLDIQRPNKERLNTVSRLFFLVTPNSKAALLLQKVCKCLL